MDPRACEKLAHLARISLSPEEIDGFAEQLAGVLAYMQVLESVDVTDVPEYLSPAPPSSPRADRPGDVLDHEQALAAAARTREGHVAVPKFMEDAGG